ncbi:S8 family serine peptidase [Bacillus salitolerans]|uniref:S8 family serine peptidase n=1 Tax=Bacillus salitolerans TaxID=1437434 RepID=A0ABW4LP54_9BACI
MKKWHKMSLALGMSASLLVPSFASATTLDSPYSKEKQPYNVLDRLNLTAKEKSELAFKEREKKQEIFSDNTLVVKYNQKLSTKNHRAAGAYVVRTYPELGYDVVRIQKGKKLEDVMNAYSKMNAVQHVQPSVVVNHYGGFSDPKASQMYHLELLKVEEALKLAGEHEVTVAVIDMGVDTKHDDLKNNVLPPYTVANPADPGVGQYHGTHVAGIIAAEKGNGSGGYGVNPNAKILPVNIFDGGASFDYALAEGILYAANNGADVINMSVGAPFKMPLVEEALKVAADKGVVIIASAGNDGRIQYNYPAQYDGVITVGATNDKNEIAEFSTIGPQIDVVAPGEDVYATLTDYSVGSTYDYLSGTSMSGPIAAAVASLIKTKHPDLNTYQVEYILEQTAKDLGDKGFDLTFGYGIVDPVAALNFDISKLPSFEKPTDENILTDAVPYSVGSDMSTRSGSLITSGEVDYVKFEVEEGEYIQTALTGSELFDYALELRFYPEGKTTSEKPIIVNKVQQGSQEGYLYKAESKGTLVVGVKDDNKNYSLDGKSTYELSLQRFDSLMEDTLTKKNMVEITTLPFDSNELEEGPFYLANEKETDKDYFTLSFEEPTMVQIDLSALPGLNTSLKIYDSYMFNEPIPDWVSEYEREFWPWPMYEANANGYGEGETLTFEVMPGMDMILEVSGNARTNDYYYYYGPIMPVTTEEKVVEASNLPYQLTMETKEIPADEDNYPMMDYPMYGEKMVEEVISDGMSYKEYKNIYNVNSSMFEQQRYSYFEKEMVDQILNSARPLNAGESQQGYFQRGYDEDWFSFTADATAAYEFTVNNTETMRPMVEIFEYDEKDNQLYSVNGGGYIIYDPMNMNEDTKTSTILEEGKQYYFNLVNWWGTSFDQYTLKFDKLMDAPKDVNEDNNTEIKATILTPGAAKTGNYALPNDIDIYYYKHREEDALFGYNVKPHELTDEQKKTLPKSLQTPIDPIVILVEDTNGNMAIDPEETVKNIYMDRGWDNEPEAGSFKAKKDVGYFIVLDNYFWGGVPIADYDLVINKLDRKDEDADSVLKNGVPTKPLSLKAEGENQWNATGYLNAGLDYGDQDYYKLDVAAKGDVQITLDLSDELNGVISVYDSNGKLIKTFNQYYLNGDDEIGILSLEKGTYIIEVRDFENRSSSNPYTLNVQWSN